MIERNDLRFIDFLSNEILSSLRWRDSDFTALKASILAEVTNFLRLDRDMMRKRALSLGTFVFALKLLLSVAMA